MFALAATAELKPGLVAESTSFKCTKCLSPGAQFGTIAMLDPMVVMALAHTYCVENKKLFIAKRLGIDVAEPEPPKPTAPLATGAPGPGGLEVAGDVGGPT